ncbi:DUF5723 family protein [Sunxiuqinia sp. A32]|uniref:DUF5723 family protein n=1 Tax=Sunxiuqinia sp. A32 TaxID=3461496 RepID=UPI004045D97B
MNKITLLILALLPFSVFAQNTMYFMDRLPQNIAYNPASVPDVKFHLELPGMGGASAQAYNSGFNYSELDDFIDNLDVAGYNPDEFVNSIGDFNRLTTDIKASIFNLGFKLKDNGYFSFLIDVHNSTTLKAASDIAYLVADYNDISLDHFPLVVDDVDLLTNSYMSIGFSYSRKINEHLTLGISPKLNCNLMGVKTNNISYIVTATEETDEFGFTNVTFDETIDGEAILGLPTEINPDAITGNELDLDEGLLPNSWEDDMKLSDLFKNKSLSLDIGATYNYNQWNFSASILNIGASSWKVNGYQLNGNEDVITVKELDKISLSIPAEIYLGAKNQFSQKWNYGLLFHNTFFNSGSMASGTLSLNGAVGKALSTSVSYTAGYKFNNLGLGFRLRFFPGMDLYFVTDNLIQAFNYKKAQRISAAFGINFSFGIKDRTTDSSSTIDDDSI